MRKKITCKTFQKIAWKYAKFQKQLQAFRFYNMIDGCINN